jgi:hypothetical protein
LRETPAAQGFIIVSGAIFFHPMPMAQHVESLQSKRRCAFS